MKKENLERLYLAYTSAQSICDPYEFAVRQKNLLKIIAECLLEDIFDEEKKQQKITGEALAKFFECKDKKND